MVYARILAIVGHLGRSPTFISRTLVMVAGSRVKAKKVK
jgi:hypothetical protein